MQPSPHFVTTRAEDIALASDPVRLARGLTATLLAVMSVQAVMGLVFQTAYRDVDWIRAAWFGNDRGHIPRCRTTAALYWILYAPPPAPYEECSCGSA